MTNVCKNTQGNAPMKLYVLHGYADGLTDPIVSTDYEEVYAAMKTAYESALNGVEQEDPDREYSFLEGWSATAVVHGNWMEWQIAELELQVPDEQKEYTKEVDYFLGKEKMISSRPHGRLFLCFYVCRQVSFSQVFHLITGDVIETVYIPIAQWGLTKILPSLGKLSRNRGQCF